MTFWKVEDRQGLRLFTQRPVYSTIHDMWMGTRARRLPRKGDRVITRFIRIIRGPKWA